ncbi:MAG TPA: hypothetical protein VOB72_10540 [Candidatus Dormibacteraeota bacterium]|nr:hypothetical protein [Candidatus Dormibacteraeota bacterium]
MRWRPASSPPGWAAVGCSGLGPLLTGVGLGVYSRLTDLVAAIVVLGLVGVPLAALNAAVGPLMLRTVPPEYVGRVMAAILMPSLTMTSILSIAVAGWLASTVLLGSTPPSPASGWAGSTRSSSCVQG